MKFGDLYQFLAVRIHHQGCNHTLSGVRDFLEIYELGHEVGQDMILDLQDFGGFCDCEVLLNVMQNIDAEREI